jgi:integrase
LVERLVYTENVGGSSPSPPIGGGIIAGRDFGSSKQLLKADFVAFLFGTGLRLGEATALQYKHFSDDFKFLWVGEALSDGKRKATNFMSTLRRALNKFSPKNF